jgi:hypothetical protein
VKNLQIKKIKEKSRRPSFKETYSEQETDPIKSRSAKIEPSRVDKVHEEPCQTTTGL